jgi:hypothetical protein
MKMVGELRHVTLHTLDETLMVLLVTRHTSQGPAAGTLMN